MVVAYLLTDQAYATSITKWDGEDEPDRRVPYYLGAALALWISWQISTIAGMLVGASVPDDIPLDFAVPLVFLVLLIPAITSASAAVAAAAGGIAAVIGAELGAGHLSIIVGALGGIAAGALAEVLLDRRTQPPPPGMDT
jgi:predicted branched-subunit amino acid permease